MLLRCSFSLSQSSVRCRKLLMGERKDFGTAGKGDGKYQCSTRGRDYGFEETAQHQTRFSTKTGDWFNTRTNKAQSKRYYNNQLTRNYDYERKLFEKGSSTGVNFDAYDKIPVKITGSEEAPPMLTFKSLDLDSVLSLNIQLCGYDKPTPVQKYGIPNIMQNRDLMACAQTGSGKTVSYLLPIIVKIRKMMVECPKKADELAEPYALILAPTRELTQQIEQDLHRLTYRTQIRVGVAFGGASMGPQIGRLMRGCEVMVATPGRLKDYLSRGYFTLQNVKFLVLDEADRMLDMGFGPQINDILTKSHIPQSEGRQTIMFSATFPPNIQRMASKYMKNDRIMVTIGRVGAAGDNITQVIERVSAVNKRQFLISTLKKIVQEDKDARILVFVERKVDVDYIEAMVYEAGIKVVSIHGGRCQEERDMALQMFRHKVCNIMIGTDVAQRGLDIPNVSHVINYDFPNDIDDYVHRIGRTGRIGSSGIAISFFDDSNSSMACSLVAQLNSSKQDVPDFLSDMAKFSQWSGGSSHRSGSFQRKTDFNRFGHSYKSDSEFSSMRYQGNQFSQRRPARRFGDSGSQGSRGEGFDVFNDNFRGFNKSQKDSNKKDDFYSR